MKKTKMKTLIEQQQKNNEDLLMKFTCHNVVHNDNLMKVTCSVWLNIFNNKIEFQADSIQLWKWQFKNSNSCETLKINK